MAQYRKKPVVIEALTWDEFIEYGKQNAESLVEGVPWAFSINGYNITHCNDEQYLIQTLEGEHNMTPNDMLIIGVKGEIYPCKLDIFEATYDRV